MKFNKNGRILIVEDVEAWTSNLEKRVSEDRKDKLDLGFAYAKTMQEAERILNNPLNNIVGAIIDNGFPENDKSERIGGDKGAGVRLIKNIRSGNLGNSSMPVILTTIDDTDEKHKSFQELVLLSKDAHTDFQLKENNYSFVEMVNNIISEIGKGHNNDSHLR